MARLSDQAQFSKIQLQQIRMVFNEVVDELVLPQFDELRAEMNTRFDGVTLEIRNIRARLDIIEHDLASLKEGHVKLFK